ncbi:iron-siderophore ABC transporter substrate-binding protein [Streptomyces sp. SID3343]|uniref:ABC transporter substrate-binding protein n=1 Tax=Streptomyces sp. SID3343 TaxID=2690260 RepID=UPI001925AF44|nr:iron-siderophore ABC transporter substrate-binding protein [Streptomyces sp. SID3343]
MPISRRRRYAAVAVALSAALLTGACGSSDSSGDDKGKPAVAAGGKEFGSAGQVTSELGTDAKPGQFPRTIRTAMGDVVLKSAPQRVVVLDTGELDNVAALGVKPVGVAFTDGSQELPAYLEGVVGKPQKVGTINSLNLEAIENLKPDLILGSKLRAEQQYAVLSKIAPTVFSVRPGYTWKENFVLNAAALDKSDEAQRQLAAYQQRAKALGDKLGPNKPTVSMVRFMPGKIRLYANKSLIGTVLQDVGLPRPANQNIDDLAVEVSEERITEADADRVFVGVYGPAEKTAVTRVTDNPLWKTLGAVKSGKAVTVTDETWYLGLGVLAADRILTDLEKTLAV